jgi:hypothetical protein
MHPLLQGLQCPEAQSWVQRWGEVQTCFVVLRGVTVAIFALCVVLRSLSSHHAWCCGCCHWAVGAAHGCRRRRFCSACGIAVVVSAARVVLRLLSLCRAWCCRCCHQAVGAACDCHCRRFAPHVVSRSQLVWHMWCCRHHLGTMCGVTGTISVPRVVPRVLSLCCTWCCGCCRWAA